MKTYEDNWTYMEESPQGDRFYFDHDYDLHRLDGPAVELANGDLGYYEYGLKHRDGGPAVITSGNKFWYRLGKLHREDGPAVEYANGTKIWYENGRVKDVEFNLQGSGRGPV